MVAGEIIEIQPNLVETKTTRKKGAQRAKKGKFSPLLPPEEMVGDVVTIERQFVLVILIKRNTMTTSK